MREARLYSRRESEKVKKREYANCEARDCTNCEIARLCKNTDIVISLLAFSRFAQSRFLQIAKSRLFHFLTSRNSYNLAFRHLFKFICISQRIAAIASSKFSQLFCNTVFFLYLGSSTRENNLNCKRSVLSI